MHMLTAPVVTRASRAAAAFGFGEASTARSRRKTWQYEAYVGHQEEATEFSLDKLNSEQRARLDRAFHMFDKDGSGSISGVELCEVLQVLGHNPTKFEAAQMLTAIDTDHNGSVDYHEFALLWWRREQQNLEADFEEQLRTAFDIFDVDGDGRISCEELRDKLMTLGGRRDGSSYQVCRGEARPELGH